MTLCRHTAILAILSSLVFTGCSAFRETVPADFVRPSVPETPRGNREWINFIRLRQDPPSVYVIGPRDILAVYIEGVLGNRDLPPPVHLPDKESNLPPAIGYPIPVREDGTISLPIVPPIHASGLTLAQIEEEIRQSYVFRQRILQPHADRIMVTLMKPRTYSVLVIREDVSAVGGAVGGGAAGGAGGTLMTATKRGATHLVELAAYENDLLHALSQGGGLPGLDAKNEVKILRGGFRDAEERSRHAVGWSDPMFRRSVWESNPNVIKIPLRTGPGELPVQLSPEQITLQTGDIVFIESREAEVFYTGGLLAGGQHPIPRDYDLDVLAAIAMAGSLKVGMATGAGLGGGGGGASSAIFPPTRCIVLRAVNGKQVPIKVNLKRALTDPRERILIQPNDYIFLEYTETESAMNVLLNMFQFNIFVNDLFNH